MSTAEQLTSTADLRLVPQPEPTVTLVSLSKLHASDLNPRRAFDQKTLIELAIDLYHKGVLQNLVARPHPSEEGCYELAAGERRHRALLLLAEGLTLEDEDGSKETLSIPTDFPVPVLVQVLTDAQLLEVATTENIQRQDMTPLEEADAFSRLVALGKKPDEIAARFGYSRKVVEQRLVLAKGLGKEGRKLLENGGLTLSQAQVVAQTSGKMKQHLLSLVKSDPTYHTADRLRHLLAEGRVLVEHALFDVEASGLTVVEDLWGVSPAHFTDSEKALALQVEALEQFAEQERQSGCHAFVDVFPTDANVHWLPWQTYRHHGPKELRGVVFALSTKTGAVQRHEGAVREADLKKAEQTERAKRKEISDEPTERRVRDAAHLIGQHARSRALWGRLAEEPKRCLALTVQGLFDLGSEVRIDARPAPKLSGEPLPEVIEMVSTWTETRPDLFASQVPGKLTPVLRGSAFHDALMTLDLESLAHLLAYLTHDTLGHWDAVTDRLRPLALHVAQKTKASEALSRSFTLTPEFLNAHTTAQLHALIQEMPEELRPAVPTNVTKKDLVGRLLEKAGALTEARWVPSLVQFHR